MFLFLAFLAVSGTYVSAFNPNPCAAARPGTFTFVNDYAGCRDYFFCNGQTASRSVPCPETQIFDSAKGGCLTAACEPKPCPDTGILNVSGNITDFKLFKSCFKTNL